MRQSGKVLGNAGPTRELVARCCHGDRSAAHDIASWLLPELRVFLRRRLRPSEDLDDAVQDAMLAILSALPEFRGDSSLLTFALGVAWRNVLAKRRQRARDVDRLARLALDEALHREAPAAPDEQALVERQRSELERLLAELPETQAVALGLRLFRDYSLSEIASETGAPLNTVHRRLGIARKRVLARIRDDAELRELLAGQARLPVLGSRRAGELGTGQTWERCRQM